MEIRVKTFVCVFLITFLIIIAFAAIPVIQIGLTLILGKVLFNLFGVIGGLIGAFLTFAILTAGVIGVTASCQSFAK